ncbi:MAG: hypothetical protein M3N30_11760, partial [Bacteroidota bacterium]|nr:hypothetical protein [Bacteroidota bacterium]
VHEVEFEMAFYTALILGISALFLKNKNPRLLYISLLALMFSFSAEFLTGRMTPGSSFVYYLLPLAATIPILVYVVFTESQVAFMQDKRAQLIFTVLLSTTLLLGTLRYASGFHFSENKRNEMSGVTGFEYLKTQGLSNYELYVFDDSNLIYFYNYFGILSPSPWIYHYFWNWSTSWDADNKIFYSILADLKVHNTRFILDCSAARNSFRKRPVYAEWEKFLLTNYSLIIKDSSGRRLWRIQ